MPALIFWVVMPRGLVGKYQRFGEMYFPLFSPEDRGGMFLRNVGYYLQVNAVLQHRSPILEFCLFFYVLVNNRHRDGLVYFYARGVPDTQGDSAQWVAIAKGLSRKANHVKFLWHCVQSVCSIPLSRLGNACGFMFKQNLYET